MNRNGWKLDTLQNADCFHNKQNKTEQRQTNQARPIYNFQYNQLEILARLQKAHLSEVGTKMNRQKWLKPKNA